MANDGMAFAVGNFHVRLAVGRAVAIALGGRVGGHREAGLVDTGKGAGGSKVVSRILKVTARAHRAQAYPILAARERGPRTARARNHGI